VSEEREAKQVIVIRRDLNMRRGKEIAQGAHASMAWLTSKMRSLSPGLYRLVPLSTAERAWIEGSFTKVVCQVPDLITLKNLEQAALDAGLTCEVITDAGKTEFGGEATITALAIGPDWAENVGKVTGDLKLY
jgi:PTH2 family peptidyl-tRNA hydrolase